MTREDFQKLAILRLKEAKILYDNGCYAGAYYLAGYSIECALKACIAKETKKYQFPPDKSFVSKCYSHKFVDLLSSTSME